MLLLLLFCIIVVFIIVVGVVVIGFVVVIVGIVGVNIKDEVFIVQMEFIGVIFFLLQVVIQ